MISPALLMDFEDSEIDGKTFSIIKVEPTYSRPVQFMSNAYIRIGENIKKLHEFPEHERAIWIATGHRNFESALALTNQSAEQIFQLLDIDAFYKLSQEEKPQNNDEVLRRLSSGDFLMDDMEGGHHITNLGAILFARDITKFPTIASKSVRVIKYIGTDKREAGEEIEGKKGYAVGFGGLLQHVLRAVPSNEQYINGVRTKVPVYPEIALREIIANALIHQDFVISGAAPVVEIYSNRIEIINPGHSLIQVDRIIDDRRSRNEKLALAMRHLGLCEERGGGLDKVLIEIENRRLPVFDIQPSEHSMRFVLPGPKLFGDFTKEEKLNACFWHCVLRYCITRDYMSNTTLRERFSLPPEEYQAVSAIISESIERGRIKAADPHQGNRNAKYVPYWVK